MDQVPSLPAKEILGNYEILYGEELEQGDGLMEGWEVVQASRQGPKGDGGVTAGKTVLTAPKWQQQGQTSNLDPPRTTHCTQALPEDLYWHFLFLELYFPFPKPCK